MSQPTETVQARRTLEDVLNERGRLPEDDAVAITLALLEAVQAVHESGRTHRGIDAASIVVDEDLRPQLPAAAPSVIFDGIKNAACPPQLHGVPAMSVPDRIDAAQRVLTDNGVLLDPRQIDYYQLGALLCRTASGHSVPSYLRSPKAMAEAPASLRPVIDRALGMNARNRMASCDDFAEALRALDGPQEPGSSASTKLPESVFIEQLSEFPKLPPHTPPRGGATGRRNSRFIRGTQP